MDIVYEILQTQKKSLRREELVTAANVAKASTGEFQEKLTNEGSRNRREGSKSALPGEKKRNLEIVSKVLKKKPPVTLELLCEHKPIKVYSASYGTRPDSACTNQERNQNAVLQDQVGETERQDGSGHRRIFTESTP
ncbi:ribosome biogenesis regulatory protein [Culex quinquefasciatus]|uniref:Ribosome biogenesis regulatory protein n=1 Tax=Culex quinquefasciatus TaxID=7176 RepID=B0WUD0_CULQU|nr:ribosome biogenesis regulatory protein [Culex quinquefasciatus]|eukprot:XP_001870935.1 ribosome biogenesis regulatory protein [Culex quinquefasciatus]